MTAAATAYVPQPGTIAARAMAILDLLPEGQSIPNAVLAMQLEQSSNVVLASLRPAERHGVVQRVSEGGYAVRWKLGDGTPPAATYGDPDEVDDAPPVQRVVKARAGDIALPEALRGMLGAPPPVTGDFDDTDRPLTDTPPEGSRSGSRSRDTPVRKGRRHAERRRRPAGQRVPLRALVGWPASRRDVPGQLPAADQGRDAPARALPRADGGEHRMMQHVVVPSPDEPGRFLVCRRAHGGQLTIVEDCCTADSADRRCVEFNGGPPPAVSLPLERPRQAVLGFYTDADAA